MTAEIVRLADRRPPIAAASADRPAMSAAILTLPVLAGPADPARASAGNAAAAAEALTSACRDLTTSLDNIHQRAAAIRRRMDALDQGARSMVLSTDTIIEALRGVVAGRRELSRPLADKPAKESVHG